MPAVKKMSRWHVSRDIQAIVRAFPGQYVTVGRLGGSGEPGPFGDPAPPSYTPVYKGEAFFLPTGATVERFGLGQVENMAPHLLLSGSPDIRQGDFVTIQGVVYQVTANPNPWDAFLLLSLKQYQQGS